LAPFVIGIAGGTGAGKTTFAKGVADLLAPGRAVLVPEDHYYRDQGHLPLPQRETVNYDHPDAIDLCLLAKHIADLLHGRAIEMPSYDFQLHTRRHETEHMNSTEFIIVEGLFTLFDTRVRELLHLKIFLDLESDLRLIRRLERDISERGRTRESVFRQYIATVRPMHERFIEPSRLHADLILSGKDAVEFNVTRVREWIKNQ
jgi:uridine kinase